MAPHKNKYAPPPLLELSGSIRMGDDLAFTDTHWAIAPAEHWAVVGPNGAGKSLLAAALAGRVPVVNGEINYHLSPRRSLAPEDAIALVSFEQQKELAGNAPAAIRWFSAEAENADAVREFLSRENVYEINPYEISNESPRAAAVFARRQREVLSLLRIENLLDRGLPALSNGEMRKILLARALLRRPRLLILDDPFTGLDRQFRGHLKRLLTTLTRQPHCTLVLIAHYADELPDGITHLALIENLRLVQQGTLGAMRKNPQVRALWRRDAHQDAAETYAAPPLDDLFPAPVHHSSATSPDELVRLEDVTIAYGGHTLMERINWTIRRGEQWALIGPNGSGKSTLLSLISGDNPQAYAHKIYLFGKRRGEGESVWDLKQRIGEVSPELHLHFPENQSCLDVVLTGWQNAYGCYRAVRASERRLARQWLAAFHMTDRATTLFGALSTGQQRLALLARALVKAPTLLLLDEPCQGLDAQSRRLFQQTITSLLRQRRVTIIYVTHRAGEIPRGVTHIMRLPQGRKQLYTSRYSL